MFFWFVFYFFFMVFLVLLVSDFFVLLVGYVRNLMVNVYSYNLFCFSSYVYSFFIFFFFLMMCFFGFLVILFVCGDDWVYFFIFFSFLIKYFVFFFSSEKFSIYLSKTGDYFFKSFVMSLIELVSEFSRPLALTVRLTVNVSVGHLIIDLFYYLLENFLGGMFFWIFVFSIFMECFVFVIQSYIFSRLIYLYLNE
uniref:ATP synthase F0 subunit 6 n=1 Tax=Dictyocaulus eckerti TaxID=44604 RepID=K7QM24_DICEC|nr:ATP synthase F0 subunit 6 [Dictyocaulus eckerti]AFV32098.1 ATP synthase F0 subunit 6 [Dictyocaulus eckerti]